MPNESPLNLEKYLKLHPADLADRLQRLPPSEGRDLLIQFPLPLAGKVLAELEEEQADELVPLLTSAELSERLLEVLPKSVADLLGALAPEKQNEVLSSLPAEKAEDVRALLRYAEDSAGGIMSDRFIALRPQLTIQESLDLLRQWSGDPTEDVSYIYVTDDSHRLLGVVSLHDLVFGKPDARIGDLMNRDVKSVRVDDDQEEIARRFEHYHYTGLPVLGRQGRLRGVVKANDALHVAQAEATEDMQLMVGLSGEERAFTPWQKSLGKRLPWLYVNLLTAFLAASVVGLFESTIAQWTVLAVFLPIIAGQGGNAGLQTITVIIRDMALGELSPGDGRKALIKEVTLGLLHGLAIGLVVGFVAFLWKGSILLGVVAALAMLLNHLAAGLWGVLIPFGLRALRIDPALASGILITTITDVAGFAFFLGLAALLLRWFAP